MERYTIGTTKSATGTQWVIRECVSNKLFTANPKRYWSRFSHNAVEFNSEREARQALIAHLGNRFTCDIRYHDGAIVTIFKIDGKAIDFYDTLNTKKNNIRYALQMARDWKRHNALLLIDGKPLSEPNEKVLFFLKKAGLI